MQSPRVRHLAAALAVMLAAGVTGAVLAACGSSGTGRHGQAITLYNGQHEQTTDAIVAAFEKKTGITVDIRSGTEDTLANQIVTEGARTPADVVLTENSPALEYLQSKGLLAKVDPATLARTDRRYDSPRGDWVGVSARVSVLIYNPSLIARSALPATVLQMADPRYAGKLAIAAGETDFQPVVEAVARADGKAAALRWLRGIKANAGPHTFSSDEAVTAEVNRGAVAFGIVNQYYWYRLRAEIGRSRMHAAIAYFAPRDPGYVVDVSGAAVLASSHHRAAAQRFLAFLVGKDGQSIIADPAVSASFEYPVDSGVTTRAPERPFDQLQPYPVTVGQLGDGSNAVALLQEAGLL